MYVCAYSYIVRFLSKLEGVGMRIYCDAKYKGKCKYKGLYLPLLTMVAQYCHAMYIRIYTYLRTVCISQ